MKESSRIARVNFPILVTAYSKGAASLSLLTTTSPYRQWPYPLIQLGTKRVMLNSAICTSLTSYSMVHPWLSRVFFF